MRKGWACFGSCLVEGSSEEEAFAEEGEANS